MSADSGTAELLAHARNASRSRHDRADLVTALGAALIAGRLSHSDLRAIRIAIAEAGAEELETVAYLRALRDLVRAAEAARVSVEQDQKLDALLREPDKLRALRLLEKRPVGPAALGKLTKKDQPAATRLLQALEDEELVAPAESANGRARPRELTPLGHHALRRWADLNAERHASASRSQLMLEQVVQATVGSIAALQVYGELKDADATRLASTASISVNLRDRFFDLFRSAAERFGLVDRDNAQRTTKWATLNGSHHKLLQLIQSFPSRWDEAIRTQLGGRRFFLIAKDLHAWRTALRDVECQPEDVLTLPAFEKQAAEIGADRIFADYSFRGSASSAVGVVRPTGTKNSLVREYVAHAKDQRILLEAGG